MAKENAINECNYHIDLGIKALSRERLILFLMSKWKIIPRQSIIIINIE